MGLKGGSNNRSTWGRDDIIDIMFVYENTEAHTPTVYHCWRQAAKSNVKMFLFCSCGRHLSLCLLLDLRQDNPNDKDNKQLELSHWFRAAVPCCTMLHHAVPASGWQWGLPHHPVPLCFLNQPVEERIPCLGSRIFRNSGSGADCGHKQIGHLSVEQICSKSHKLSVNSTTRWPADSNCIVAKMHLKRWCPSSILIGVSKEASSTFLCELCSTYAKPHAGSRTV